MFKVQLINIWRHSGVLLTEMRIRILIEVSALNYNDQGVELEPNGS